MRKIVGALIEYKKHKKFVSEQYKQLDMSSKRGIKVEDLLQIFVDDINQMKDFLQHVIETYGGESTEKYLTEIASGMNLYHRLLECYLYLN